MNFTKHKKQFPKLGYNRVQLRHIRDSDDNGDQKFEESVRNWKKILIINRKEVNYTFSKKGVPNKHRNLFL